MSSKWITRKEEEPKWITKKDTSKPESVEKEEFKGSWIKKKDSAQMSGKETVSDAQKRGKRELKFNFKSGGRVGYKDGGCMQIKGWGKARKR